MSQVVTVLSEANFVPAGLVTFLETPVCEAANYTGQPTQWSADPTEQMAAADCVLGNGVMGCAGGCGSGGRLADVTIRPPPNDYVTTLGQAEVRGEGVLLHNGHYREDVVDVYIPGRGLDFVWKRSYQSGINLNGYLGKNWDFSWGAHFIVEHDQFGKPSRGRFSRGDCRRDLYDNAVQTPFTDEYAYATKPTGYFDIKTAAYTWSSEVRQIKRNGFKQIFDKTTGRLKSRADRYGNTMTALYSVAGKLTGVQDTLGRTISLSYYASGAGEGRLSKVTDFANREVTYEYADTNGGGTSIVLTKVLYPPTDWLDDTTNPWTTKTGVSRTIAYAYDSTNARLTTVTDGRGKVRVENIYDGNGRVDYQRNYSSGSVYHDFTWTVSFGKVTQVTYKNRSLNESIFYFDANHLVTSIDEKFASEGSNKTATTVFTRGCTCTLPTAIRRPDDAYDPNDGGYTTFTINSVGDVTEKRRYADNSSPYTTTAGSDLVQKAYFAAVNSSQFGVMTSYVGPRAFTASPSESPYTISISYDLTGNPTSVLYPDTTNPSQTGHAETRTYNSYGQLLTVSRPESILTTLTYYGAMDSPSSNLGYLKEVKVRYSGSSDLITSYTYSNYGANTLKVDPNGEQWSYVVDNEFLVKQATTPSPFSYIRKFTYNGNRQLIKEELIRHRLAFN